MQVTIDIDRNMLVALDNVVIEINKEINEDVIKEEDTPDDLTFNKLISHILWGGFLNNRGYCGDCKNEK
jgi:hypothetical protein